MTVVLDRETDLVLYIGEGRDQNALLPFWKRLRKSRTKILGVATDMSPAYTAAVREHLPDALHVHDRFHVMNMFNEAINNIRRGLARKIQDKDEKSQLKGIRYILLKCPENLDSSKDEPERLERALKMNEDLSMIYYLKEELHSPLGRRGTRTSPRQTHGLDRIYGIDATVSSEKVCKNFTKTRLEHFILVRLSYYNRQT